MDILAGCAPSSDTSALCSLKDITSTPLLLGRHVSRLGPDIGARPPRLPGLAPTWAVAWATRGEVTHSVGPGAVSPQARKESCLKTKPIPRRAKPRDGAQVPGATLGRGSQREVAQHSKGLFLPCLHRVQCRLDTSPEQWPSLLCLEG